MPGGMASSVLSHVERQRSNKKDQIHPVKVQMQGQNDPDWVSLPISQSVKNLNY